MNKESPKYWGSLEEYEQTEAFLASQGKEFVTPPEQVSITEMERRDFLKIMGAGMLFATAACYRRPVEKIIPYVNRPLEVTPGIPDWYTSTCTECSVGCGLLVKTREGRPVKLEGNESHPLNQGGLCARGQASILNLYDPDRLRHAVQVNRGEGTSKEISWKDLDEKIKSELAAIKQKNGKIYLLTGSSSSPSQASLIQEFLNAFPGAAHVSYDATLPEEISKGQELSYGQKITPRYRIDQAKAVVTFGADFLGTWLSPVEYARGFAKARKVEEGKMNQLLVVESVLSLTGSNADQYLSVKSGDELSVALAIAHEILVAQKQSRYASDGQVTQALSAYAPEAVAAKVGVDAKQIKKVAQALIENKGQSLVLGGSVHAKNGLALQVVANLLNSALENDGVTVDTQVAYSEQLQSSLTDLTKMIDEMKQGKVAAVLISGTNPVYTLGATLGFKDALKQVPLVISVSNHLDETGAESNYVAASTHYLEAWGDANPQKGLYSVVQPAVLPLYDVRSFEDSLIVWSGIPAKSWYEYVRGQWQKMLTSGKSFDAVWTEVLQKGYYDQLEGKRAEKTSASGRSFNTQALQVLQKVAFAPEGLSLALYPSLSMSDGRSANNSWLQELPDPVSRITWENYLSVAPAYAKKNNLAEGDVVKVEASGLSVELPIHIQPKLNELLAMTAVGYGRTRAGRVGNKLGANVYPFQTISENGMEWGGQSIKISKTGKTTRLGSTQGFYDIEDKQPEKRGIIQELNWAEMAQAKEGHAEPAAHGEAAHGSEKHGGEEALPTMWSGFEYKGHRWGMAIDMNSCIGCGSCVIGCQAENNIPVVGKEQVANGRIMHWIRIDRYYAGAPENPQVTYQPMMCQHCENAPCETVCPVIATMHDDEGLNVQVYNRCVGTRYCSNNCPYKVRRFNFFDYTKQYSDPVNLVLNPEVTVRTRGVMEKCTFCVQRVVAAKDKVKAENRKMKDGDVKAACQQSCPTDAIVFGDINDPESAVSKWNKLGRGYHVLEDINVKPQVTYLKKVRNV